MWPFGKTPKRQMNEPETLSISPTDDLHTRVSKALRYGGLVNANRTGLVDSAVFLLGEYERIDAEADAQTEEG